MRSVRQGVVCVGVPPAAGIGDVTVISVWRRAEAGAADSRHYRPLMNRYPSAPPSAAADTADTALAGQIPTHVATPPGNVWGGCFLGWLVGFGLMKQPYSLGIKGLGGTMYMSNPAQRVLRIWSRADLFRGPSGHWTPDPPYKTRYTYLLAPAPNCAPKLSLDPKISPKLDAYTSRIDLKLACSKKLKIYFTKKILPSHSDLKRPDRWPILITGKPLNLYQWFWYQSNPYRQDIL